MALVPLSEQDDYDLVNSEQDCRGWLVHDGSGTAIGRVREMIVDTEHERVSHLILEDGAEIPARQVSLTNNTVVVRGYTGTTTETTTTTTQADVSGAAATAAVGTEHTSATHEGEMAIPVIEEEIRIGKRAVETGGVRVSTHVEERPVEESVTLHEERVHVERRAVNEPVAAGNVEAFKEGVVEVSLMGEEVVAQKQARVVEEVVINKETIEHQETVRDTVRRTDVEVEQIDGADTLRRDNQ